MQKRHNKEEIIEVGQELFRKRSFNNTGVDYILIASETPNGSFYNFFKSKEEFGVEVLKHYTDRQYNYVKDLLENFSFTPLPRLKAFYNALIKGHSGLLAFRRSRPKKKVIPQMMFNDLKIGEEVLLTL